MLARTLHGFAPRCHRVPAKARVSRFPSDGMRGASGEVRAVAHRVVRIVARCGTRATPRRQPCSPGQLVQRRPRASSVLDMRQGTAPALAPSRACPCLVGEGDVVPLLRPQPVRHDKPSRSSLHAPGRSAPRRPAFRGQESWRRTHHASCPTMGTIRALRTLARAPSKFSMKVVSYPSGLSRGVNSRLNGSTDDRAQAVHFEFPRALLAASQFLRTGRLLR